MTLEEALSQVTAIVVDEPLIKSQCKLGEGPIWDPRTQKLSFIDILNPHLHLYDPKTGEHTREKFDEPIGCLALRSSGGLACGAKRGFGLLEEPGKIKYLIEPFDEAQTKYIRFNDGACDRNGVFWAGTLEYETEDGKHYPGQLWRFDPQTKEATMVDDKDLTDSNAIGWSADHKTMYFVNSTINIIYAYDYDVNIGTASNRRVFIDGEAMGLTHKVYGNPDGFCIDKEGCIWCARWKGTRILRFTPDGKSVDLEIHIPKAYNVTACCFGGPEMDKLFITTASCYANSGQFSEDENAKKQEQYPYSGDVFMVDFSDLKKIGADKHKGVPLSPGFGDFTWRHMFPY